MGCTKWSGLTFITLGVAALIFFAGIGTEYMYTSSIGLFSGHEGLFDRTGDGAPDEWKTTQAFCGLTIILMAASGVTYLIMLCCGCDCGRRFMLILQGGLILGAAACTTIALITFGAYCDSDLKKINPSVKLGYSYYLIMVAAIGMYAAGVFTIIDMIKGD